MNIKNIEALIELLNKSNLETLSYKDDTFEVELKKASSGVFPVSYDKPVALVEEKKQGDFIKSELVGVFYTKPNPDSSAFVDVGSRVEKGDVICIIEAMKVMNEIKASKSYVIEEVLVSDGEAVDFDQPLFRIS